MATLTKDILSGSTDGKAVKVAATATPGTTVHTGSTTVADLHEVWLWAVNSSASNVKLTIEWGGTTSPDNLIEMTIPAEDGPVCIVPGWVLKGNAVANVIRAFAATADVVMVYGYVNKIT
jgi:hypothetical protein